MEEQKFIIEVIDDPESNARFAERMDQFRKNADWLHSHWSDVLPQANGKFVAVAGQQAYIADDPVEARRMAIAAHPHDQGVYVKYVNPFRGPRIYGRLGPVAS
jgi:hypothetical protein